MSKARDLANLARTATVMATDTELSTAIATEVSDRNAAIAAIPLPDSTPTALMTMGA
jgi:hypothetical protein